MSRGVLAWPVVSDPSWAGVHGLQHVQGLAGADFADDDAVGTHAQGVAHQLADGDGALALDVGRTGLERDDVLLAELQLGGVLDGDDALVVGDERGQHVQRGRLARAGTAGDEDVEPCLHAGLQEVEHLGRGGAEPDEVVDGERRGRELADGDDGPDQAERRDDGVDTRAIGEASIDHGAGFVDAPADGADDAVDDAHHVIVVLEREVRELELAGSLDVDLPRTVDHDLGDGLVAKERLERPESDDLVGDLLEHAYPLGARQGEAFLVDRDAEDLLDLGRTSTWLASRQNRVG
jgi:hypothetical protein